MAFALTSPAFRDGQPVPREFTCQGRDASPALAWANAPAGTVGFALVLDDPDAPRGTWTHWTWWDLPAGTSSLPAGADLTRLGATEGETSAHSIGYHGPCPPSGRHRYIFTLHALGQPLGLARGAAIAQVHAALKGKSLASCRLMGTYEQH